MTAIWNPDGQVNGGLILPEQMTVEQLALHEAETSLLPTFSEANGYAQVDLPQTALGIDLEIKLGKVQPCIWQQTGSCVGAGGAKAFLDATIGDIAVRGDREEIKNLFWLATYGVGRDLGGMRRKGEGSFGGAQARAMNEFGMLPLDFPGLPQPKFKDGWMYFTEAEEFAWSHPSAWPIPRSTLEPEAKKNRVETKARITSTDEAASAKAQGYGITLASSFGSRNMRVVDGFLMADWNGTWQHQMSCNGYHTHPSLGRIWWIQNQWFKTAHPSCPFMSAKNLFGGFWVVDSLFGKIIKNGDVNAISSTTGFPLNNIQWGGMGIV